MLTITTATALFTTLLFIGLSLNVSRLRLHHKVSSGDGGHKDLGTAIRAHANLVEQALPFFGLLALAEAATGDAGVARSGLAVVAAAFVLARLTHATGMLARRPWLRRSGHVATLLLLLVLGAMLTGTLIRS
jgi:uncharacterized membrane protein YecN with MAPEG domain